MLFRSYIQSCDFYGKRYSLKKDSNFKKKGERNFEYTLILETAKADAMMWKVRHIADNSIKFAYTAKAHEHLRLLVENLNRRDMGWKVGDCIEGTDKVINYNHTYILDALNQLADTYETEWQITGKTVHLRKVEYNKNNPLKLSYVRLPLSLLVWSVIYIIKRRFRVLILLWSFVA